MLIYSKKWLKANVEYYVTYTRYYTLNREIKYFRSIFHAWPQRDSVVVDFSRVYAHAKIKRISHIIRSTALR